MIRASKPRPPMTTLIATNLFFNGTTSPSSGRRAAISA